MANEKRLIDANDHKEYARQMRTNAVVRNDIVQVSQELWEQIATIIENAEGVVHGKWTAVAYTKHCNCDKASNSFTEYLYKCSACNRVAYKQPYGLNYCPNCGAKMEGGNEDGNL